MELPCYLFRVDAVVNWADPPAYFSLADVSDGLCHQNLPWWVSQITGCWQFLQAFIDLGDLGLDDRFCSILGDVCMVHGDDI